MKEIYKKTWPEYFEAVEDKTKPFEIRKDEDDIQTGDILVLEEWDNQCNQYTGRVERRKVGYVLRNVPDFGLKKGFCIIGLLPEPECNGCRCDKCIYASEHCGDCEGAITDCEKYFEAEPFVQNVEDME